MARHHLYLISVCLALLATGSRILAAEFAGGAGTADDPYQIATAEQLDALGADPACWDKHFKLIADIDLSGYGAAGLHTAGYWVTSRNYKAFTGVFDGDGHSISGFIGARWNNDNAGLFRHVADPNAQIRNVTLIDPLVYAQAGDNVGSLVGYLEAGSVVNCHVKSGLVLASDGTNVGMLVGSLDKGTISDCSVVDGMVSGKTVVGGLVGNSTGTITHCRTSGTVTGGQNVGGIVGTLGGPLIDGHASCMVLGDTGVGGAVGLAAEDSRIAECSSSQQVTGASSIGGLVGLNAAGAIAQSFSVGDTIGANGVGGLVGGNQGTITNCYSLGRAIGAVDLDAAYKRTLRLQADSYATGGDNIGGLVGSNSGTIMYCYSAGQVKGRSGVGGLVGAGTTQAAVFVSFWDTISSEQSQSAGGSGRTTNEMKMVETFVRWGTCGNAGIWTIDQARDYPRLAWEERPGHPLAVEPLQGAGTQAEPYLVRTAEELNRIGLMPCTWDKHFKLTADIDLAELGDVAFNIIGRSGSSSGIRLRSVGETLILQSPPFSGVFDGNGKTIRNLTCTSTGTPQVGLFAYVDGESAEVRDLTLADPNLRTDTSNWVGALVGWLQRGTIINCRVHGGRVDGSNTVGGMVGYNGYGGSIVSSRATAAVRGKDRVGGLAGSNEGTVTNCYATGPVTGARMVGGLVGSSGRGEIINCYSAGAVAGEQSVGGLVGYCSGETYVVRSFWDNQTSGQQNSAAGVGKTTAEMQTAGTFMAWGGCTGVAVWTIDEGRDYPRLVSEARPGAPLALTRLSDFLAGSGTQDDPYVIHTAEGLNAVGLFPCEWDKCFRLSADVDLTGYPPGCIGDTATPFTGVFDGNGHVIAHFKYSAQGVGCAGLFGVVSDPNAEIRNITLVSPDVSAPAGVNVGSLVGSLIEGTIRHCAAEGGTVTGTTAVGGLVGANGMRPPLTRAAAIAPPAGRIVECRSSSSVTGLAQTGGLVGSNGGLVARCHADGSVSGMDSAGGLIGAGSTTGTVLNCYSTGNVFGSGSRIAGLVGHNSGDVRTCYASGSIRGRGDVGGLVGSNFGVVAGCYCVGRVDGDWGVGGLVGSNYGSIMACYSTAVVSGKEVVGGLASRYSEKAIASFWDVQVSGQTTSACGEGKTSAQMHDPNTFMAAGWDFVGMPDGPHDIWAMDPTTGYPILWWQLPESELPVLAFAGGTGLPQDPYLVSSAQELNSIGYNPRLMMSHFKLINPVDLAAVNFFVIGSRVCPFAGVFDGADLPISSFTCTSTQGSESGLFAYVDADEAIIRDVVLTTPQVDVPGSDAVGSLVGYLKRGTVTGCQVQDGSITGGTSVGGLTGRNGKGTIRDCRADAAVTGEYAVGGLLGGNDQGSVMSSCSMGPVRGKDYVGGLVGSILAGSIANCYTTGSVTGERDVGGLVGSNDDEGAITNCYSAGALVSDDNYGGGLVGHGWSSGGVNGSFWDIEANGRLFSNGGLDKTTAEMQTAITFTDAGWDFVDTWMICEGRDYPRLRWEGIVCGQ